jgi:hypothetical protein
MKNKLIIFSLLFVGSISQCSLYERMKAKAASAAQSVRKTATSAYDKVGGMARSASDKLQSTASNIRNTIGRESEAFINGVRSVPGQLSEIKENIEDKLGEWGYRVRKSIQQLNPTMDKVTYTNVETGETVVDYVSRS